MRLAPAPKQPSMVDKAKELEDYMYEKGLNIGDVRELLAIIEFSKRHE